VSSPCSGRLRDNGQIVEFFQPSAARTLSRAPRNPSDESLGYFQSSAERGLQDSTYEAKLVYAATFF
jgi:hypothetical protein